MPNTGTPAVEQRRVDVRGAPARRPLDGPPDRMIAAGSLAQHLRDRHRVRHDLGVDPGLAHPAGDQLGVLGAEVDDEDRGRLHSSQGSQSRSAFAPILDLRRGLQHGGHTAIRCEQGHLAATTRPRRRRLSVSAPPSSGYQPACAPSPAPTARPSSRSRAPAAWSATPSSATRGPHREMQVLHGGRTAGGLVRCTNLDTAACNWLVDAPGRPSAARARSPAPGPPTRDTAALAAFADAEAAKRRLVLPARRPRAADRRPDADPAAGWVRPAVQRRGAGHHRARRRRHHDRPGRGRRRAPRAAARPAGRALPHDARPPPARDRPLLLDVLVERRRRRAASSGSSSATSAPTTPRPSSATTRTGRPPGWEQSYVTHVRHHAPVGGLGRDVRPLPAHPRHPCRRRPRTGWSSRARRARAPEAPWTRCPGSDLDGSPRSSRLAAPDLRAQRVNRHGQGRPLPVRAVPTVMAKLGFVHDLVTAHIPYRTPREAVAATPA